MAVPFSQHTDDELKIGLREMNPVQNNPVNVRILIDTQRIESLDNSTAFVISLLLGHWAWNPPYGRSEIKSP